MIQKRITSIGGRITAARKAASAVEQYAATVVLHHNTKAIIDADIAAAVVSGEEYADAKAELRAAQRVLRSVTLTARSYTMDARDVLEKYLGKRHSPTWDNTGFDFSLRVKRTPEELEPQVDAVQRYFSSHPDYENEKLNVTAARGETLFNELFNARKTVRTQKAVVESAKSARDGKIEKLGERITALFGELKQVLDPLNPLWPAFGFNKPGAIATPDVPEHVAAVLVGLNAIAVNWASTPRAEHYRVWVKVNGIDEQLVAVGSPADLDFTIEGLPANTKIEIAVSAVNNGGESARSAVVIVTTQ